jgi:hypothetical protein
VQSVLENSAILQYPFLGKTKGIPGGTNPVESTQVPLVKLTSRCVPPVRLFHRLVRIAHVWRCLILTGEYLQGTPSLKFPRTDRAQVLTSRALAVGPRETPRDDGDDGGDGDGGSGGGVPLTLLIQGRQEVLLLLLLLLLIRAGGLVVGGQGWWVAMA